MDAVPVFSALTASAGSVKAPLTRDSKTTSADRFQNKSPGEIKAVF